MLACRRSWKERVSVDWAVLIRVVNTLGSLFALVFLLKAAYQQWPSWNLKTQQHWWALIGWVGLCVEGSLESYFLDVPVGPRTVLTTLVIAWTLRAILIDDDLYAKSSITRKDQE
jgi:hypothetical protein